MVEREQSIIPKGPHKLNIVFLAGAAVASFFFAGGVFYLTRQRPRPQPQALIAAIGRAPPVIETFSTATA